MTTTRTERENHNLSDFLCDHAFDIQEYAGEPLDGEVDYRDLKAEIDCVCAVMWALTRGLDANWGRDDDSPVEVTFQHLLARAVVEYARQRPEALPILLREGVSLNEAKG